MRALHDSNAWKKNAQSRRCIFFSDLNQFDDPFDPTGGGGGGGVPTGASAQSEIAEFEPDGGTLALAYGMHLVGGHLILREDETSPEPTKIKLGIGLGEGGDQGWDSAVKVWWVGEELSVSPDADTPGYRFHRGIWSTGESDPEQGQDPFFTDPLTFSGTAYSAIRLTDGQSTPGRVDGHRGIYKCLRVFDYTVNGVASASSSYSTNPALIIADGFRRAGKLHRVHWQSLIGVLKPHCDETIPWDKDGDGMSVDIPRFAAHPVWTRAVGLTEFLDAVCLLCGADWQDDGKLVRFKLATDQTPRHHFTVDNIAPGSFQAQPDRLSERTNWLVVNYRDTDDEFLKQSKLYIKRESLIEAYGEIKQEIFLPNMKQSQAARIGQMLMRLSTDNPNKADLVGYSDSFHLLKGDYAAVTHPVNGWENALVRVESKTYLPTSNAPDRCRFTVRKIEGEIYKDTDHTPKQDVV